MELSLFFADKTLDRTGEIVKLASPKGEIPAGQVAQLVERGPEKAGVAGSIPVLTIFYAQMAVKT